jgi:arabinan endo-1,5-alpha-L-arabinosidase
MFALFWAGCSNASVDLSPPPPEPDPVAPGISVHPQEGFYALNETPTLLSVTASVSDGGTLTYQWYRYTDNPALSATIEGAINSTYSPLTTYAGTMYYYVVVTNTKNGKTAAEESTAARIVVSNPEANPVAPTIDTQPQGAFYYTGETAAPLEVTISRKDDGEISYQWYSNTVNAATEGAEIQEAVNASYTPSAAAPGTTYYYVVITNTKNAKTVTVTSATAKIEVLTNPLRVKYVVNSAGNGFENIALPDGNTYTAIVTGGSFTAVNGLKVFDTSGTDSGTDITASWDSNTKWDHYTNVGYVDLGAQVGELLRTLENFSIETYVYVPADYQIVSLGNYVWTFADSDTGPGNAVWFSYRDGDFTIKKAGTDESVKNGYNTIPLGSWHQILVTKNSGTAVIYVDGSSVKSGTSTTLTTGFAQGTFTRNYLGKPAYSGDEYLHNSRFYSFSVYDKAFTSAEVTALYAEGPMTDLKGGQTRPGAGFTFSDASAPAFANVSVHDPSIFINTSSQYRVIGSFLSSAYTTDFIKWYSVQSDRNANTYSSAKYYPKDNSDSAIQTMAQQISDVKRGDVDGLSFYASDIHKMPNGKFYHYYSITTSWKCSAIGVAIADAVEGNYVTQGLFVRSAEAGNNKAPNGTTTWSSSSHPNCIDPQAFFDKNGNFWLVYGSWSGGIFIYELDTATGKPKTSSSLNNENAGYGRKLIANSHTAIEAPYILYSPQSDYYYLFTSFGGLSADEGYNMRVFRSLNPDGPYEDAEHTSLTTSNLVSNSSASTYYFAKYGVKITGGYQFIHLDGEKGSKTTGYLAPGHNSAYYDEASGRYYLIHHTRFVGGKNNIKEAHEVRVRELFLTEDNWLAASPFRYDAGTVRTFTAPQLVGTWKIINHARDVNTTAHTSQTYRFTTNGKVLNEGGTEAGTWELGNNGKTARITIGGVLYKGVFLRCYDEDNTMWVQAFTALSNTGIAIWGAGAAFN